MNTVCRRQNDVHFVGFLMVFQVNNNLLTTCLSKGLEAMGGLPFLFSRAGKWVLLRHITFWLSWYLFQVYLYSFTPSPILTTLSFWKRIQINAGESFFYLIPNLFLAYTIMYVVIPNLIIPQRYLKAAGYIILLIFITGGLSALVSLTIIEYLRNIYYNHNATGSAVVHTPFHVQLFLAWISGLRGSITIGGMAAAIKLVKYFYEQQQRNLLLEKEMGIAELQSLKAQLHPHFLFNTLNNIYSHTQDKAPEAAGMLLGLSSLLRFMLYQCNASRIALQQEVAMIGVYIELEKKRYGNQLELSLEMPANYHGVMIAPLLILPFIENCFKHGTSNVLEKPWITIQIKLEDTTLHLKLINGYVRNENKTVGGIGIQNVRKRLELLYPGKHELQIVEEEEMFIVSLTVQLATHTTEMQNDNSIQYHEPASV